MRQCQLEACVETVETKECQECFQRYCCLEHYTKHECKPRCRFRLLKNPIRRLRTPSPL